MTIKFGVSPIAWANDDMPELGGDTPLDDILSEIQSLGFEGVELGGKFPREPNELRELLGQYQLDLIGGWYSTNLLIQDADAEIAAMQGHLALLKELGSEVFVAAETSNAIHGKRSISLGETPELDPTRWPEFGDRLTKVARYVGKQGLKFAYHHHLGTVFVSQDHLEKFLANTGDEVGLTLDTGHAVLGGIDPLDVIDSAPERVVHVHCKDVRIETFKQNCERDASFLDGVVDGIFTVPGDGSIEYLEIMKQLHKIEYSGWIVLEAEQDPAVANPHDYARLGLDTLRKSAIQGGLIR
ncbi:MAG: myo-inosose-2 dehydratase [Hyphomonas sp.]|nr:myo-inosose-2 dehydratase [Hyphomonas sp.]